MKESTVYKDCPFCGSHEIFHLDPIGYQVKCRDCGALGPVGYCYDDGTNKWNNRVYEIPNP